MRTLKIYQKTRLCRAFYFVEKDIAENKERADIYLIRGYVSRLDVIYILSQGTSAAFCTCEILKFWLAKDKHNPKL